jgi:L-arabinokinase
VPLTIAFYISGHGFGHAARQIEIMNALAGRATILVRTEAPHWLFERTVRVPFRFFAGPCDTGVVQIDSLRLDEEETVRRAAAFHATFEERAAREAAFLHEQRVDVVVSDAPPLACAAAALARRRAIVISNFTWGWIYDGYRERFDDRAPSVIPAIREAYSDAWEGWRLPMHGGFAGLASVRDLPWVARHATVSRDEVLRRLGIPAARPLALSSFGGYGLRGFDPATLDCLEAWTIVMTGRERPPAVPAGVAFVDEDAMYAAGLRYEDLVAACDIVVTKPGYGIISECVANDTALLCTSRGRFAEYDVMVAEMPRVLRCAFIEQDALRAGRWQRSLDVLLASPPAPEHPPTNGAEVAADWLLRALACQRRSWAPPRVAARIARRSRSIRAPSGSRRSRDASR